MIVSGSHVPGVDAAAFGLPAGTALRYERPAPALAGLLASYAVLDSDPAIFTGPDSWILPSAAQIWIGLTPGPISVRVRNRNYAPIGSAMLFGPTSTVMPVTSQGGVTVVVDVKPAGWARLFTEPADSVRDRIVPLDRHLPLAWVGDLVRRLHASDRGAEVKELLDSAFAEHLPPPIGEETLIARTAALLGGDGGAEIATLQAALGVGGRTLLRLCNRYFGFGPKLLQRRSRFLRALTPMLIDDRSPDVARVPDGYHDTPHFLRDAGQFLGMTPRRFLSMPMPYLRAALRARGQAIGAPVPMLDLPPA